MLHILNEAKQFSDNSAIDFPNNSMYSNSFVAEQSFLAIKKYIFIF